MTSSKQYSPAMVSNVQLYDRDFYAWAIEQAALLRARKFQDVDIENIAEEIESVGRSEKRDLINRLAVLFLHLLKWRHQPGLRNRSWQLWITDQRRKVTRHLADNPSLKHQLPDVVIEAYADALIDVQRETGFEEAIFPKECPWTFEDAMRADWYPD